MTLDTLLPVFLLALVAIGLAVAAMAVGVIFKRPCLRGSCGGAAVLGPDGNKLSCATCPNRKRQSAQAASGQDSSPGEPPFPRR
ncbi:MAG TPA: (Na+)-NQR maturation NqrM [Rubrivivax sp.]